MDIEKANNYRSLVVKIRASTTVNNSEDLLDDINNLHQQIIIMADSIGTKANIISGFSLMLNLLIMLLGVTIGFIIFTDKYKFFISGAGFSITLIKSILSITRLEGRSLVYKEVSIGLKRIGREIKDLRNRISEPDIREILNEYFNRIDELEIRMFEWGNKITW